MIGENFGMIDFRNRGINIDTTFRCTLECPGCSRTKFKKLGKRIPGKDLTIEQFDKITDYFVNHRHFYCAIYYFVRLK